MPPVYEVRPRTPASPYPPGTPGVSRLPQEAPCKSEFSCSSGPRRGGTRRLPNSGRRAGEEVRGERAGRDRNSKVATSRPNNPRCCFLEVAPSPANAGADGTPHLPTCSGEFPAEGSPRPTKTRSARTPGQEEVSDRALMPPASQGGESASTSRRRSGVPDTTPVTSHTDLTTALGAIIPLYKVALSHTAGWI